MPARRSSLAAATTKRWDLSTGTPKVGCAHPRVVGTSWSGTWGRWARHPCVRQNGRALLLLGHRAVVRWLAFEPTHDDDAPRATSDASAGARRLIASIGSDGRVMLHQVPLPSGEDGEEGEEEDQIDGGRAQVPGRAAHLHCARRHAGACAGMHAPFASR